MRLLAIGDIHGCYRALTTLAEAVPFREDDRLVTLGDYVDRGPESRQVIEWVMDQTRAGRCVPLRGNHEVMMLAALRGQMPLKHWLGFGGREALDSYASVPGRRGTPKDVPLEHQDFLLHELRPFYETEAHMFVHAGLAADVSLALQSDQDLYWSRFEWIGPHVSGKTVICGHTAQKSGLPGNAGHAVCIDTWVYGKGWLTCLDVATGQYWQANQQGTTRTGRLGQ